MSWKERVAGDPHGSLERSAARKGLSVEEMRARRRDFARTLEAEGVDEHLSVNELYLFRSDPEQLSQAHLDHLDGCEYCKTLDEALSPETVRQRTASTADGAQVWGSAGAMMGASNAHSVQRSFFPQWAVVGIAAALPLLLFGLLFSHGTFRFSSDTDRLLESPVSMLVSSVEVPADIRPTTPVSLYSGQSFASTLQSAACAQSRLTVSNVGTDSVELSWEQVPSGDIPSYCMMNKNQLSLVSRQNIAPFLSVGQQVMVMTPPVTESDL